jgi:hypothetical protein
VYRAHETDIDDFITKIEDLTSAFPKSILLGDINLDLLKEDHATTINYRSSL